MTASSTRPSKIQIGDILLETTAGQKLTLRRVARPNSEQKLGGEVDVQIGREGPDAIVTIRDSGVGISAEHLPRTSSGSGYVEERV